MLRAQKRENGNEPTRAEVTSDLSIRSAAVTVPDLRIVVKTLKTLHPN